jgi:hypothetical protein
MASLALGSCTDADTQPAADNSVDGTITTISISDHPTGLCHAQEEYTDVTITFSVKGDRDTSMKTLVSPAQIVTRDPCTTSGSYSIELDRSTDYEVCIDRTSDEPGAMDIYGFGTCGIHVTSDMLQDGQFDITFNGRLIGKDYSTYS